MEKRVYNFSAGPAVLPLPALEEAQRDLLALPGVGISILEISHRSATFKQIIEKAEANLRKLLAIPDDYHVLFLQGGAQLQFAMVPMNLLRGSGQVGRLHHDRLLGQEGHEGGQDPGRRAHGLRRRREQLPPHSRPGRAGAGLRRRLRPHHLERDHPGHAVRRPSRRPATCRWCATPRATSSAGPLPIEKYGMLYACARRTPGRPA